MYRLRPKIEIKKDFKVIEGYKAIISTIKEETKKKGSSRVVFEMYPGADKKNFLEEIKKSLKSSLLIDMDDLYISSGDIDLGI